MNWWKTFKYNCKERRINNDKKLIGFLKQRIKTNERKQKKFREEQTLVVF